MKVDILMNYLKSEERVRIPVFVHNLRQSKCRLGCLTQIEGTHFLQFTQKNHVCFRIKSSASYVF